MDKPSVEVAKGDKHQGIMDSIDHLQDTVGKVESLLIRITEGSGAPTEKTGTEPVTLLHTLDNAASYIWKQTEKLHSVLGSIEAALF